MWKSGCTAFFTGKSGDIVNPVTVAFAPCRAIPMARSSSFPPRYVENMRAVPFG